MKAVVMAGGFGTRIQPLTNSMPKPMLPIMNKPMMEHIIKRLKAAGIKEFVVLLYFMPDVIRDYFKDGKKWGVHIDYVLPDDDYGTAGAVKWAEELLKDESFIIVSGDLVTDFDFSEIITYHKNKNSALTITLTSVQNPLDFGVVIAGGDGRIKRFLEKPSWGEVFSDTINTGIYVIEPEILAHIPKEENFDFAKDLFPKLMHEGTVLWGCTMEGYWRDVGNPHSYREVFADILGGKVNFPLPEGALACNQQLLNSCDDVDPDHLKISGKVLIGKDVKLGKNVTLHNAVIGDGVSIGEGCVIKDTVIWNDVSIKKSCRINNAVICAHNRIGKKVKATQGVIIAENCEIDDLVSFENDLTVWPAKVIDEASIVSNNVIWGSKYKNSLFENGAVIGRTNLELSCEMSTKLAESFGSILPAGSTVYVSRDYHKSSRMLKRAFLGGLLSCGINVMDLQLTSPAVMRYNLAKDENVVAGVHFEQSLDDQSHTKISFYTGEGLLIDTNSEKSIERLFFRERFNRVNYMEIGEIFENVDLNDFYIHSVIEHLDISSIKQREFRLVIDLLFGTTVSIYPDILNELEIDSVTLNAYMNDRKLTKVAGRIDRSKKELSGIVKAMEMDMGYLIYPGSRVVDIVCDNGLVLERHIALLFVLALLNDAASPKRVLLPAWAPDYFDQHFENLTIERGKISSMKGSQLARYDFIGGTHGSYAFTELSPGYDSLFATLKILEMLSRQGRRVSEIATTFETFYFKEVQVACASVYKGLMMRRFLEDSIGKDASHVDGVKIWTSEKNWVLMVPDQTGEYLRLYVQAESAKEGEKILGGYQKKIAQWIRDEEAKNG